ncbi:TPA: 30S ribosomal protein S13 [bacterium]|nr:30S ribosomal protein S13 [bacterium]
MARIVGVDLPKEKRIEAALSYIYGIGSYLSRVILTKAKVDSDKRTKDLSEEEITAIRKEIETSGIKVEGDLRKEVSMNIKRLIEIGSYRGLRHRKGLPVRGQRTHTNARTKRGAKKTIGVKRKK